MAQAQHELRPHPVEERPVAGTQEAIIADFDEPFRQDMLQETLDEPFSRQGTGPTLTRLALRILECDLVIFHCQNAVITERNAKNIRSEIFQGGGALTNGAAIHHPIVPPDVCRNSRSGRSLAEGCPQLATKEGCEGPNREQKCRLWWQDNRPIRCESDSRDQVVNMRMVAEVAGPGLQHPHHPKLSAKQTRIACKLLKGRCRGAEKAIVELAFVRAGDITETSRQRKRDQKIGHREQAAVLLHQPGLGCILLAGWTVAIPTGMVVIARGRAAWTDEHLPTEHLRTARFNRDHGTPVMGRERVAAVGAIRWPVAVKDCLERCHAQSAKSPRIASVAIASACWVRCV